MAYIEEKTPGGITIKVILNSWEYTAFNKSGNVIYADALGSKVLHKVPVVAFFGQYLKPVISIDSELAFFKIRRGEIVIPYEDQILKKRKYLFLKNDESLELIPVRVVLISNIYKLVRDIENGVIFNYIVIDKSVSKNEIIVIKNRCPSGEIIQTGLGTSNIEKEPGAYESVLFEDDAHLEEIQMPDNEKNLNIMSNNPVFLAKIHLKKLALSKVNQILLDFDISSLEAEYMLRFIETMLQNQDADEEVRKAGPKLEAQADAFRFYINVLNKNDNVIRKMIMEINDQNKLSSYNTLLAKVKVLFSKQEDILLLTEYENLLFEKKGNI
jgi:hypothetical protein